MSNQDSTQEIDYHHSQYNNDGSLAPLWPAASHFATWNFFPFMYEGKPADLYFAFNGGASAGELLIGIQTSGEDGDYVSPHLVSGNRLHWRHAKRHRHDLMAAYLIACNTLGVSPILSVEDQQ